MQLGVPLFIKRLTTPAKALPMPKKKTSRFSKKLSRNALTGHIAIEL
jgi:hypothetical protein